MAAALLLSLWGGTAYLYLQSSEVDIFGTENVGPMTSPALNSWTLVPLVFPTTCPLIGVVGGGLGRAGGVLRRCGRRRRTVRAARVG